MTAGDAQHHLVGALIRNQLPGHAGLDLVLRLTRVQRLGEVGPERIEPQIGHLEKAADVLRLLPIEKQIRFRSGRVHIAGAAQKPERV